MTAVARTGRVLSGMRPTGRMHLGNYVGALENWVRLQDEGWRNYHMVADWHMLTTAYEDTSRLQADVFDMVLDWLAAGLDPEKSVIFVQSEVKEHAELHLLLSMLVSKARLERIPTLKEQIRDLHLDEQTISYGHLGYSVLQAADILLYKATHVPVGEDQKQHVELTRDIAGKFNHDFDAPGFFPLPEPMIEGPGARIMSLRDGSSKMSKSDPSDNSRINLMDDADTIAQKIRKAKTDPEPLPETLDELKDRPEAQNLIGIYAALDGRSSAQVLAEFAGQGFGAFKPKLADLAVAKLGPVGAAMRDYMSDPGEIDSILAAGAERARTVAAPVLAEVKKLVGYWGA